jgi:Fe2+ or Zn2+ uptake regulation protein
MSKAQTADTSQAITERPDSGEEPRDLVELLHSRGQRVTSQRLVILRELRRRRQHATAEELHRAVHEELPGISVPTIYATLDLFVELGLARRIDTATAALYDAGLEPHQHAVCRRCGKVQDVDGQLNVGRLLGAATAAGFQAQRAELIITGLCADCAASLPSQTGLGG